MNKYNVSTPVAECIEELCDLDARWGMDGSDPDIEHCINVLQRLKKKKDRRKYENNTKSIYEMSIPDSDAILDNLVDEIISEKTARKQLQNLGWSKAKPCGCLFPLDGCCDICYPGA